MEQYQSFVFIFCLFVSVFFLIGPQQTSTPASTVLVCISFVDFVSVYYFCFVFVRQGKLHITPTPSVMDFNAWNIIWSLIFGLLALLIVVGNFLTILIFLKQSLRKRPHFLLISLAVADLLVGLLTVPLYIAVNTSSVSAWLVYTSVDIFTGLTSIFTLAVISLERMYAIGWPLRHRALILRSYKIAIVTPWITAVIVTSIFVLPHAMSIIGRDVAVAVVGFSPATTLLVMWFAYCVLWWKERSRMVHQNHQMGRETKLTKTLLLVIGASLLTWLPFQILNITVVYFARIEPFVAISIKLLQFINSLVNVIIYPFRISEFKVALLRMLQCFVTPFRSKPSRRSQGRNRSEGVTDEAPI